MKNTMGFAIGPQSPPGLPAPGSAGQGAVVVVVGRHARRRMPQELLHDIERNALLDEKG